MMEMFFLQVRGYYYQMWKKVSDYLMAAQGLFEFSACVLYQILVSALACLHGWEYVLYIYQLLL